MRARHHTAPGAYYTYSANDLYDDAEGWRLGKVDGGDERWTKARETCRNKDAATSQGRMEWR